MSELGAAPTPAPVPAGSGRWALCCPSCRSPLSVWAEPFGAAGSGAAGTGAAGTGAAVASSVCCPGCGADYQRAGSGGDGAEGIWDLLRPEDRAGVERFLTDYTHIRRAEGRGSEDAAYYRALPATAASDPLAWQWSMRARSWRHARPRLFPAGAAPRRVIDIGAGVGWLSNQLRSDGHDVVAVDLSLDPLDGLAAARHYEHRFACVRAHFDHLPFEAGSADVVLFNASLHYSVDYRATMAEALRVLRPDGRIAVLDSPIYRHDRSGRQMVAERHADFERRFGLRSDTVASRQYLTPAVLDELAAAHGVRWSRSRPFYGWRWAARPWVARVRRRREPSRFELLVAGR